jgi:hypothetical protein
MMDQKRLRLWLPLGLALADLAWACSALSSRPEANPASSVEAINSAVWIFLHLPAALLGSLPFDAAAAKSGVPLPQLECALIAILGAVQTAGLVLLALIFFSRKKKA